MVSERFVRLTIVPLAGLTFITAVVTLGLAAALESHWASHGFPSGSYRDRERILLAASIWTFIVSIYSLVGTFFFPGRLAFGVRLSPAYPLALPLSPAYLPTCSSYRSLLTPVSTQIMFHLIAFAIAFILYLIGASSITALIDKVDCDNVDWSLCGETRALTAFGWLGTVFTFAILIIVLILGIKSRSGTGMRKGALTDA
ncbi:hypothetical protein JCM10213_002372 [Rhodosporidiobolus nylandii]